MAALFNDKWLNIIRPGKMERAFIKTFEEGGKPISGVEFLKFWKSFTEPERDEMWEDFKKTYAA